MRAERRYWDEEWGGWINAEPARSTEDEFMASLEEEPEDLMPEVFVALQGLTEKQRFVIECRYGLRNGGRQMTVDEIAGLLGVSHPAIVRLMQRAMRRLERELCQIRASLVPTATTQKNTPNTTSDQ